VLEKKEKAEVIWRRGAVTTLDMGKEQRWTEDAKGECTPNSLEGNSSTVVRGMLEDVV